MTGKQPHMSVREAQERLIAPGAPFEMEQVLVNGRMVRSYKSTIPTLRGVFDRGRAWGDRAFLTYEGEQQTFAEHFRAAGALARVLQDKYGVVRGDRVVIAARNIPEWSLAFWAGVAAGAVIVPLNAWGQGADLIHGIDDSGAKAVFVDEERLLRLAPYGDQLSGVNLIALRGAAQEPAVRLDDLIGPREAYGRLPDDPPHVDVAPDDVATIFYTSGTTGRPKGAVGTHRNLLTNLVSAQYHLWFTALRKGSQPPAPPPPEMQRISLLPVPLFHVTGCHAMLVPSVVSGARLILMHKWNPERFIDLIESERVNATTAVPSMVWQVLESPALAGGDLSSLAAFGYGGGAAAPELTARFAKVFPWIPPRQGYGATETSSLSLVNAGDDYLARPDSIGIALPVVDVRVLRADGQDAGAGEAGELLIRGPNVVAGYWNQPDASGEAFEDGWYHTGDIVRRDDEGFVYLLDRAKDMLIRGGENIYCVEIESALVAHPSVLDAAVVGLPHRVLGEEVAAIVQIKPDAELSEAELQSFVRDRLAAHKTPVRIDVRRSELPKNAAGKTLKRELRAELVASGA